MPNNAIPIAPFSARIRKASTVAVFCTIVSAGIFQSAALAQESQIDVASAVNTAPTSMQFQNMQLQNAPPLAQPFTQAQMPTQAAQATAITEREVQIGGVAPLHGVLTMPVAQGDEKVPCVVLIHGVGRNDKDNSIGPNRPFLEVARNLAAQGIAVLRYDKRTFTYPLCALDPNFGVEQETVDDALAAIEICRQQPEIDASKVYVCGHSMGGLLAGHIAERDSKVAGVIILCSPGRKLEEISQIPAPLFLLKSWLQVKQIEAPAHLSRLQKRTFIGLGSSDLIVPPNDGMVPWKSAVDQDQNLSLNIYNGMNHFLLQLPNDAASNVVPGHVPTQLLIDISAWMKGSTEGHISQELEHRQL